MAKPDTIITDSISKLQVVIPDTIIVTKFDTITTYLAPIINNMPSDSGFWNIDIGDIITGILMPAAILFIKSDVNICIIIRIEPDFFPVVLQHKAICLRQQ